MIGFSKDQDLFWLQKLSLCHIIQERKTDKKGNYGMKPVVPVSKKEF